MAILYRALPCTLLSHPCCSGKSLWLCCIDTLWSGQQPSGNAFPSSRMVHGTVYDTPKSLMEKPYGSILFPKPLLFPRTNPCDLPSLIWHHLGYPPQHSKIETPQSKKHRNLDHCIHGTASLLIYLQYNEL